LAPDEFVKKNIFQNLNATLTLEKVAKNAEKCGKSSQKCGKMRKNAEKWPKK
jgi:hypothetical protein